VADFPKVVYLLTFDKKVVIEALRESQGISGENYLEKSSNSPSNCLCPTVLPCPVYSLPGWKASWRARRKDSLTKPIGQCLHEGIEHFISTPRKINLLTNTLSVTYRRSR